MMGLAQLASKTAMGISSPNEKKFVGAYVLRITLAVIFEVL
jgi:hypothetical protein